jgi:hypothetical protein
MRETTYSNEISNRNKDTVLTNEHNSIGSTATPPPFQISAPPIQREEDGNSSWYDTLWDYATDNKIGTALSFAGESTSTMGNMWRGVSALESVGMETIAARNAMGLVRGAGKVGNVLAPLGLISETSGLMDNILGTGDAAERSTAERMGSGLANTAALGSSVVGSAALATEGLTALGLGAEVATLGPAVAAAGPAALVAGAFAGGYAAGDWLSKNTSAGEEATSGWGNVDSAMQWLGMDSLSDLSDRASEGDMSAIAQMGPVLLAGGLYSGARGLVGAAGDGLSAVGGGIADAGSWALDRGSEVVDTVSNFASDNWTLDTDEIDWGRTLNPFAW